MKMSNHIHKCHSSETEVRFSEIIFMDCFDLRTTVHRELSSIKHALSHFFLPKYNQWERQPVNTWIKIVFTVCVPISLYLVIGLYLVYHNVENNRLNMFKIAFLYKFVTRGWTVSTTQSKIKFSNSVSVNFESRVGQKAPNNIREQ